MPWIYHTTKGSQQWDVLYLVPRCHLTRFADALRGALRPATLSALAAASRAPDKASRPRAAHQASQAPEAAAAAALASLANFTWNPCCPESYFVEYATRVDRLPMRALALLSLLQRRCVLECAYFLSATRTAARTTTAATAVAAAPAAMVGSAGKFGRWHENFPFDAISAWVNGHRRRSLVPQKSSDRTRLHGRERVTTLRCAPAPSPPLTASHLLDLDRHRIAREGDTDSPAACAAELRRLCTRYPERLRIGRRLGKM